MPWMKYIITPFLEFVFPLCLRTPDSSAESMLLAATLPAAMVAGRYLSNATFAKPNKVRQDGGGGTGMCMAQLFSHGFTF